MIINKDLSNNIYNKYVGTLEIHEIHKDYEKIHKAPNVITYDARQVLSFLIAGDNLVDRYIKYLQVGTDITVPTRADSALGGTVDTVEVTYTFPDIDRVQFEGILSNTSSANGYELVEAGLFNNSGQMFARQAYPIITKTSAIQLKYIWTIIFT